MDALSLSGLEALSSCPAHCALSAGFGGAGDTAVAAGMSSASSGSSSSNAGQQRRNRYGGLSVLMANGAMGAHASATISHLDGAAHPHLLAVLRSSRRAQRESLGDFGEHDRDRR